MAQAFAELSVAQIQAGLTAKEFSAKEVAENSLARIVSADKAVHAFLETTEEAALAAAARVDAAIAAGDIAQAGPLAGVPVAFKDNMNLEGTHTTCSSRMLESYVSPYTATCVSKIIEAGTSADGNGYLYPDAGQNFMEFFLPLADGLDASMVTAEDQQILSLMDTQTKAYATGEKDLDTALADLTASIHDTFSYLSAE